MTKFQSIAQRFIKAFIAGFISSITIISVSGITHWGDLNVALNAIILSGVVGGINGIILATEKWASWEQ